MEWNIFRLVNLAFSVMIDIYIDMVGSGSGIWQIVADGSSDLCVCVCVCVIFSKNQHFW